MLLQRYRRILASSHTDLGYFGKMARQVVLAENGVDTSRFAGAASSQLNLTRWIYWGRLARNKRLDALLHLIASLAQAGLRIDLAICGSDFDGTLPALQQLTSTLGIGSQVSFRLGPDDKALRREINARSVFVLPSEYEGFGLSLLEAMSAGLVCICRNAEPMNVLGGEAATLLAFDNGPGDVQAVRQLLTADAVDVHHRIAAGVARAATFDWSTRFQPFLQLYEECAFAAPSRCHPAI